MIKLEYEGDMRKIRRVKLIEDLLRVIRDKFEDLRQIDQHLLKLSYIDVDGDRISISTTEDLEEAYSQYQSPSQSLKISLNIVSVSNNTTSSGNQPLSTPGGLDRGYVIIKTTGQGSSNGGGQTNNNTLTNENIRTSDEAEMNELLYNSDLCNSSGGGNKTAKNIQYNNSAQVKSYQKNQNSSANLIGQERTHSGQWKLTIGGTDENKNALQRSANPESLSNIKHHALSSSSSQQNQDSQNSSARQQYQQQQSHNFKSYPTTEKAIVTDEIWDEELAQAKLTSIIQDELLKFGKDLLQQTIEKKLMELFQDQNALQGGAGRSSNLHEGGYNSQRSAQDRFYPLIDLQDQMIQDELKEQNQIILKQNSDQKIKEMLQNQVLKFKLISHKSIDKVPQAKEIEFIWKIQNLTNLTWPEDRLYLQEEINDSDLKPRKDFLVYTTSNQLISPKEIGDLKIKFTSPQEPGHYNFEFIMILNDLGELRSSERLRIILEVEDLQLKKLQMQQSKQLNFINNPKPNLYNNQCNCVYPNHPHHHHDHKGRLPSSNKNLREDNKNNVINNPIVNSNSGLNDLAATDQEDKQVRSIIEISNGHLSNYYKEVLDKLRSNDGDVDKTVDDYLRQHNG
eukprot:403340579